jgi:GDPmannose 4,6-dehydratase
MIAGASGQTGALLASLLLGKGFEVIGTSRNVDSTDFWRLEHLGIRDSMELISVEPDDFHSVHRALTRVEPDQIYYLSGQTSVALSFEQPFEAINSIVLGQLNFLESIRLTNPAIRFFNAASTDCFGNQPGKILDETSQFQPTSPYGIAKSASYWTTASYRNNHGIFASNGILSNHESPLRGKAFVTHKIVKYLREAAEKPQPPLILGNTSIKRDWVWAPDVARAIFDITNAEVPNDYIVATGQSHSLKEFIQIGADIAGVSQEILFTESPEFYRSGEIESVELNPSKITQELGWKAELGLPELVRNLLAGA